MSQFSKKKFDMNDFKLSFCFFNYLQSFPPEKKRDNQSHKKYNHAIIFRYIYIKIYIEILFKKFSTKYALSRIETSLIYLKRNMHSKF